MNGVWFNYTGKYTGTGAPALNDPKWKALPAQPGGQHDADVRGFDKPYQPGVDKGKGDWFVWKDQHARPTLSIASPTARPASAGVVWGRSARAPARRHVHVTFEATKHR